MLSVRKIVARSELRTDEPDAPVKQANMHSLQARSFDIIDGYIRVVKGIMILREIH